MSREEPRKVVLDWENPMIGRQLSWPDCLKEVGEVIIFNMKTPNLGFTGHFSASVRAI